MWIGLLNFNWTDRGRHPFVERSAARTFYTLIKRLLGFCTITPPLISPPHAYSLQHSRVGRPEHVLCLFDFWNSPAWRSRRVYKTRQFSCDTWLRYHHRYVVLRRARTLTPIGGGQGSRSYPDCLPGTVSEPKLFKTFKIFRTGTETFIYLNLEELCDVRRELICSTLMQLYAFALVELTY